MYCIDIYTHIIFLFFCEIWYSKQYKVTVSYSPTPSWQVCSIFFRYYWIHLLPWLLFLGPASRLRDRHSHMWLRYIDITIIMVWCMSSILIRTTYFYFYTICNSEHYRVIVGYSPTPGQQVGAIWWNITITIGFISHIFRVTYYFVFMLESFTSQKYRKQYLVIILSYRARASEPQVDSMDQTIVGSEVDL